MTYTSHGHHIAGTVMGTERPDKVARCGGPGMCKICSAEAAAAQDVHSEKPEVQHFPVYILTIAHDLGLDDAERIQRAVTDALHERGPVHDRGPDTLTKVYRSLGMGGFAPDVCEDIVRILHNNGIVFRETS